MSSVNWLTNPPAEMRTKPLHERFDHEWKRTESEIKTNKIMMAVLIVAAVAVTGLGLFLAVTILAPEAVALAFAIDLIFLKMFVSYSDSNGKNEKRLAGGIFTEVLVRKNAKGGYWIDDATIRVFKEHGKKCQILNIPSSIDVGSYLSPIIRPSVWLKDFFAWVKVYTESLPSSSSKSKEVVEQIGVLLERLKNVDGRQKTWSGYDDPVGLEAICAQFRAFLMEIRSEEVDQYPIIIDKFYGQISKIIQEGSSSVMFQTTDLAKVINHCVNLKELNMPKEFHLKEVVGNCEREEGQVDAADEGGDEVCHKHAKFALTGVLSEGSCHVPSLRNVWENLYKRHFSEIGRS